MLSAQITLPVDTLNSGSTTDQVFDRFAEEPHKTVYVRDDHQVNERHELTLLRRFPTRSGNFLGTQKCTIKLTDDRTVVGVDGSDIVVPSIAALDCSLPVGMTTADKVELRQRFIALLDSAEFDNLFVRNKI